MQIFAVLLLQHLPVMLQSIIAISFGRHHEMNPSKGEEMHSHLESIKKMRSYADQS